MPVLLVIDAMTELQNVAWDRLQTKSPVRAEFEALPRFAEFFKQNDIEEALQYAIPLVLLAIQHHSPDCLVVHSKGVAIVTYLYTHELWSGPVLLLSPIPNKCAHLQTTAAGEDPWADDWASVLDILDNRRVAIGLGDSIDEQVLIDEFIGPPASKKPNWLLLRAHGDHDWPSRPESRSTLESLLDWLTAEHC
jgi:hypothetical protein